MKKGIFAALIFASTSVFAGKLNVALRIGHDDVQFNDAGRIAGGVNTSRTYLSAGRLQYIGNVSEDISYKVSGKMEYSPGIPQRATDGVADEFESYYIDIKLNPNLNLTVGRQETNMLANEYMSVFTSFMSSRARVDLLSAGYYFATGFKLTQKFMDTQRVELMLFNQSEGSPAAGQTRNMGGVFYTGAFMDNTVIPMVGYHKDNRNTQAAPDDKNSTVEAVAAGIKWDPKPYYLTLDYLNNTRDNMSGIGIASINSSGAKNVMNSVVLGGGYQIDEQWLAKFKYDSSNNTATSAAAVETKTSYAGTELTAIYQPKKSEMFFYEVSAYKVDTKPDGADAQSEQHIMFGLKLFSDLLK